MAPESVLVSCIHREISGEIKLNGSKSISNRALLIRALCKDKFNIFNLSDSDDTAFLNHLLNDGVDLFDAHHAGTTYRFLTAYLATKEGTQILTGSERMQQRPVKVLVDALNQLGANITYVDNEGYPPIKISSPNDHWGNEITLPADISSQYISALLMIAPTLPDGLRICLEGEIVSGPYIEMTIGMMNYFGVSVRWHEQTLIVPNQEYISKDYHVESDWSAASYYYIIAALSERANIELLGLHQHSLQGDAAISEICQNFGIESLFFDNKVQIIKKKNASFIESVEYDFIKVPDLAQSVSVICAGLGVKCLFSGLQTLRIKETDRILALQNELMKLNVTLHKSPEMISNNAEEENYKQEGKACANESLPPIINTYNDHRMAMAFATLGLLFPIRINDPQVVSKSYPGFWKDLEVLRFDVL
ncbi:MAG: 3-phosphoshikimate 1-carboxyvinyltransferase [Saprospiraceae bacterium]|nr:3-phosphoshikimate 1-carboxyvinyltransferase [Saprospiraceae bacterium]